MRAKIDINEVERRTKIRAKYLRALENEEWDLLPGEVYVKSFLRTYGDFLGLDSRQLMDDYKRRYEHPSDQEMKPITPRRRERERERRRGPLVPPWLVIGLVLVAVVAALYFVGRKPSGGSPGSTATHSNTSNQGHNQQAGNSHRSARARHRPPAKVKLQLVATGQVYVCLVDGAGKPLIPGVIFSPGQTIPTKTSSKLLLTLGNASVKMTVNGKPVAVAPSASAIGYMFTPTAHSMLPAAQQPHCA